VSAKAPEPAPASLAQSGDQAKAMRFEQGRSHREPWTALSLPFGGSSLACLVGPRIACTAWFAPLSRRRSIAPGPISGGGSATWVGDHEHSGSQSGSKLQTDEVVGGTPICPHMCSSQPRILKLELFNPDRITSSDLSR